ncbi:MAG TPA: 3'-5' exonuclease [Aggregatilinea sp.]|uniref:3'-5' exonuclease n=1 Tax=Aggregatilinea sp. TaxID=2806333 RepID=UPI002B5EDDD2|nr:3'-5' exonuclease [Aggregatilinea sp.]HML23699.1 3'-5' exonuclease [Aggregatilinea sp.]
MLDPDQIRQARAEAAQWAYDLLQSDFVIFDSETTGTGFQDELVQVGVIDGRGETVLDTLVKPTRPIDPGASRVHGLSAVHLIGAPAFKTVYPDLAAALGGKRVVAYNVDFDRRILYQSCALYDLPRVEAAAWECAMKRYAAYFGSWNSMKNDFRWHKLEAACANEDVNVYDLNAHSAVDDCRLTLRLIQKMAEAVD